MIELNSKKLVEALQKNFFSKESEIHNLPNHFKILGIFVQKWPFWEFFCDCSGIFENLELATGLTQDF